MEPAPPRFIVWTAIAALVFIAIGVLAGPIFHVAWLAKTCAIGASSAVVILMVYVGSEVISAISG